MAGKLIILDVGLSGPITGLSFKEITSRGEVLSLSLGQKSPVVLSNDTKLVHLPDGVVYSASRKRLFVTNMGVPPSNDGSVFSLGLDGSDPQIVIPSGQIHTPKQLAIDDVNGKLYFSDREGMRIMRANLDGTELETLFRSGTDVTDQRNWCVGIAVSPTTQTLYWTQKGSSKSGTGRIFSARTDSTKELEPILLLDKLPEPIDLHIDEKSSTLYWTDRGELPFGNTLNRLQLEADGRTAVYSNAFATAGLRHEIITLNFDEAIGLAHDDHTGRWYISDMGGTIWSVDANGGGKQVVFHDKQRAFTGIVFIR